MAIPADSIKCKGKRIPTTTSSSPPFFAAGKWMKLAPASVGALLKNGVKDGCVSFFSGKRGKRRMHFYPFAALQELAS